MPSVNVQTVSISRQQVLAGQEAEFSFSESGCSVTGVSFVSETGVGTVIGKVETLNSLPDTVPVGPDGAVYQYMNIVVGSQFFGESSAFERAFIDFKVPRTWVEENNIDEASLVLNRFHDNTWAPFATEKTGKDAEFLYFRAETPGFSCYSITGEKQGERTIKPVETPELKENVPTKGNEVRGNEVSKTPSSEKEKKSPGFGLGSAVMGILSVLCLLKKSKEGKKNLKL